MATLGKYMPSSVPTTASEHLYAAVLLLASEQGRIEERLRAAYWNHLRAIPVSALPVEVQNEWKSLCAELEGALTQTSSPASPATFVDLAQRVLLVYDSLIR